MDLDITLSNYRCFTQRPVTFTLTDGATAFLGPNNMGKTAICKLFHGLRPVFGQLATERDFGNWMQHPEISRAISGEQSFGTTGRDDLSRWAARHSTESFRLSVKDRSGGELCFTVDLSDSRVLEVQVWSLDRQFGLVARPQVVQNREFEQSTLFDIIRNGERHTNVGSPDNDDYAKAYELLRPLCECLSMTKYIPAGRHTDVPPWMEPIVKLELWVSQRQPCSFAEA